MVLLTGSNGFLGQAIIANLSEFTEFDTLSRSNSTYNSSLEVDIPRITQKYDYIIHAAGKAHSVSTTRKDKQAFFDVNLTGTQNLLKGIEEGNVFPRSFIFISSVAVYGQTSGQGINESHFLNATDAYGKSKIEAERLVQRWCMQNNIICTILRLPLVAGLNPPGNLQSMKNGIQRGYYLNIAGGKAKKSIVLAEDVAKIIPKAACVGGIYNLTDGYHPSFLELSELIANQLGKNPPVSIPDWLATIIAKTGDVFGSKAPINSDKLQKITSDLTFDDSKARRLLGWDPTPVLIGFKIC